MKARTCPFCGETPSTSGLLVAHHCPTIRQVLNVEVHNWNTRRKAKSVPVRHEVEQMEMPLPTTRSEKQRLNDLLLCELAAIELCAPVTTVAGPDARRHAAALKIIRAFCPNVTIEDIRLRAEMYRRRWPNIELTSNALAKWWAKVGSPPPQQKRFGPPTAQDQMQAYRQQKEEDLKQLKRQYGIAE
jgi:hypothetical protein